jgi:dihydrofolate reductase
MLIFSMGLSADGYIADRDGRFDWAEPDDELTAVHLERVSSLGAYLLGRRLHDDMLVWETDPAMRATESLAAFADVWTALPKIVFSRTRSSVAGTARLATKPFAEEVADVLAATDRDVEIGGAHLAAQAFELDLIDELRLFRYPVIVGGGTPYFPPLPRWLPLTLLETRPFGNGVISERYRRDRSH